MYARLFRNPAIEALFDKAAQSSGEQPRRLAGAILAYARNIDKLANLGPAVSRMVARHAETGVKAEHYPYVAEALLPAIRSEEHTSELQSLMRISYAVFCLKKKKTPTHTHILHYYHIFHLTTAPY